MLILWFHLVLGDISEKGKERLLARLEWALRPIARVGAFLTSAYRCKHSNSPRANKGLICPIFIVVYFAFIPRCFHKCPRVQSLPPEAWWDYMVFVDAAPGSKNEFRADFFFPRGGIDMLCGGWVLTL